MKRKSNQTYIHHTHSTLHLHDIYTANMQMLNQYLKNKIQIWHISKHAKEVIIYFFPQLSYIKSEKWI